MFDLVEHLERAFLRCAGRQLHLREQETLVLVRQEGGRHAHEQDRHAGDDQQVDDDVAHPLAEHLADPRLVAALAAVEDLVEAAEEPVFTVVFALVDRLQQRRTQRRRQDQGDQHREHHRRNDGDRELAVDDARRAAEKGHRHEHGREHQRDADQRADDLVHRLLCRFLRRQAFLAHHTLDVLDDDDGVVNEQADGEHGGEHGQGVDRVAEHREHAEGAEQHDRYGDGRDQRRAEVLQEQPHHEEDEDDGFDQRVDDFLDRDLDEGRRVVRDDVGDAVGEVLRQLLDLVLHALRGGQRVGTGGETDGDTGGRLAVVAADHAVRFGAEFEARDVAQIDLAAVGVGLEQDFAELLLGLQTTERRDRRVQLLPGDCRRAAELAGRDLRVLRLDRRAHVGRGQLVTNELGRVEPDAHRVLRAEHLRLTDAGNPAQRVLHVGDEIVGEVGLCLVAFLRNQCDQHQEVARRLGDLHALRLHDLRQRRQRQLQLVLHLHLRDVRVGAGVERQRYRRAAVGIAGRRHVEQVVEAGHLLFDDLRHRVFERLRRGARVGGVDDDLGRRDRRILRDWQRADGQRTGQHDDDGDHPRKDGAIDKETCHELFSLLLFGCGFVSGSLRRG